MSGCTLLSPCFGMPLRLGKNCRGCITASQGQKRGRISTNLPRLRLKPIRMLRIKPRWRFADPPVSKAWEPLNKSAAALSGSFVPTYWFENLEIHKVFLRFPNLNLETKSLADRSCDLIRGSLGNLHAKNPCMFQALTRPTLLMSVSADRISASVEGRISL